MIETEVGRAAVDGRRAAVGRLAAELSRGAEAAPHPNRSRTGTRPDAHEGKRKGCGAAREAFAATAQQVLEEALIGALAAYESEVRAVEGIVVTGGVALNVRANSALHRRPGSLESETNPHNVSMSSK